MEPVTALAQVMMHGPPGDWDGPPGPFVFLPFLLLFWVLLLALIAWAALRLIPRWRTGTGWPVERKDPAEQILRERFARGEITADEYEWSLKILRGDGATEAQGPTNPQRYGDDGG
jgi:putative membrane protein